VSQRTEGFAFNLPDIGSALLGPAGRAASHVIPHTSTVILLGGMT